MKKVIAKSKVILLLMLVAMMLTACGQSSKYVSLAQKAAEVVGEGLDYDYVLGIKYTKKSVLNPNANLEYVNIYDEIPGSGYVFLFDTIKGKAFDNYVACFLNSDGDVKYSFSYADTHASYERFMSRFSVYDLDSGEKALSYLSDCNYMSGMLNYARDEVDENGGENHDNNSWFTFSESEKKRISSR